MSVFISDTIMVGRLGTDAIAAVGLAGTLISMIFSSLNAGTISIVARHIGAKEINHAQIVGAQAISMSPFTGIIITPFLIFFPKEFLVLMSAEPKIVAIGKGFLQIVGSFLVFRLAILGTVSLAAHQIAIRIELISFMPGFALAISTATLVGQSLGAKCTPCITQHEAQLLLCLDPDGILCLRFPCIS